MKSLSCTHIFCRLFVYPKISQPACDALRLWYLPRHDANPRREEWQHGNVSSCNCSAPRLLTHTTLEVSNTVLRSLPVPPHNILPPTDSKSDMWSLGMILHKLVFFRLPYRWAEYGDRPGLYGSDTAPPNEGDYGKDNDTDRLEREVSSYPGFKSTPRLETLFTSRTLPRSYLVLLESLLNVTPAARPSCEKVLAALHLGLVRMFTPPAPLLTTKLRSSTRFSRNRACRTFSRPGRHGPHRTLLLPSR